MLKGLAVFSWPHSVSKQCLITLILAFSAVFTVILAECQGLTADSQQSCQKQAWDVSTGGSGQVPP